MDNLATEIFENTFWKFFLSICFSFKERMKEIEQKQRNKGTKEEMKEETKVSLTKSDDSGYSSATSLDEDPVLETLVSNLKKDLEEKAILTPASEKLPCIKCRINRNFYM